MDKGKVVTLLRSISKDMSAIADLLQQEDENDEIAENTSPVAATAPRNTEAAPAAKQKVYSFEEVRGILAKASHEGQREEVRKLVLSHGQSSLSAYKDQPDVLAALVKEVEGIGNAG